MIRLPLAVETISLEILCREDFLGNLLEKVKFWNNSVNWKINPFIWEDLPVSLHGFFVNKEKLEDFQKSWKT